MSTIFAKRSADDPREARRVYGRRIGRALSKSAAGILEELLPAYSVPEDLLRRSGILDPASLYPEPKNQIWMEIGFGSGEHLAALLRKYPDTGFIGAEPFINGMATFLKSIGEEQPRNIRVLMDNVMHIVCALKDRSLDRIYILNPDPWPKKRHIKRRILVQENLDGFARVLKSGGLLVMATDVDDMAEYLVTQAAIHPVFEWMAEKAQDWQSPPADWIKTRYAEKGEQKGHRQTFLVFRKI